MTEGKKMKVAKILQVIDGSEKIKIKVWHNLKTIYTGEKFGAPSGGDVVAVWTENGFLCIGIV